MSPYFSKTKSGPYGYFFYKNIFLPVLCVSREHYLHRWDWNNAYVLSLAERRAHASRRSNIAGQRPMCQIENPFETRWLIDEIYGSPIFKRITGNRFKGRKLGKWIRWMRTGRHIPFNWMVLLLCGAIKWGCFFTLIYQVLVSFSDQFFIL